MSSTQEIIRIADARANEKEQQVTFKTVNNNAQIIIGQIYSSLLEQSWMQKDNSNVLSKTLINGSASQDLNLEVSFILDDVILDQVYKQQIKQGQYPISINKLFTELKKGGHKLIVTAKVDAGSFIVDTSNSNQFITYK